MTTLWSLLYILKSHNLFARLNIIYHSMFSGFQSSTTQMSKWCFTRCFQVKCNWLSRTSLTTEERFVNSVCIRRITANCEGGGDWHVCYYIYRSLQIFPLPSARLNVATLNLKITIIRLVKHQQDIWQSVLEGREHSSFLFIQS